MTYQASVAYPAGAGGQWPSGHESAYQQYYGYGQGYDMSAYYHQQASQYPAAVPAPGAHPDLKATNGVNAPSSAPQPPKDVLKVAGCAAGKGADEAGKEETTTPPPPPPPPPPPESQPGQTDQNSVSSTAAAAPEAATTAVPSYDSAAYAQWYAQTYGGYYGYSGYPGYDQQAYAYWQQQQQPYTDAYGYASQANAYHQQAQAPPQPEAQGVLAYGKQGQQAVAATADDHSNSYNAQPPPSNLYVPSSANKGQQDRSRFGATGTNTVPLGARGAHGSPMGTNQQPQPQQSAAFVIRPQIPVAKRPNVSAAPAYISVGGSSAVPGTRTTPAAAAPAASTGKDPAVAAAVAAGVASAAAAAAVAKASQPAGNNSNQWPPSFTAWVTRCFNAARLRNISDARLSEKLMLYLDKVKAEGKLWTTDWDTLPLMLPDGSIEQQGSGASTPGSQVLSVAGGNGGPRRSRWGAVQEAHASSYGSEPDQQPFPSSAGRQPHGGQRKRLHAYDDSDDEEDWHSGDARYPKTHALSTRKRKKALQHEQLHQQQHRAGRRGGRNAGTGLSVEEQRRRARAGRFGNGRAAGAPSGSPGGDDSSGVDMSDDDDLSPARFGGIVVGTCQALEKSYFRLTSQPDPATVRPEPVLERALERLVSMIARGEATYFYSLDQFKGMRQDCTVQHLRNSLAVRVYEAHARSSLEYGDVAEFNQCQARLGHLYGEGQPGGVAEFTAYRLLYETAHCATAGGHRGGGMAKALLHTMQNIPKDLAAAPEIRHALQVREAVMTANYAAFFRLYATAPYLGRALMDAAAEHMRFSGLNAFVKACDLPIPVADVALLLGFSPRPATGQPQGDQQDAAASGDALDAAQAGAGGGRLLPGCRHARLEGEAAPAEDAEQGATECAAWLRDHGAVVVDKGSELLLDCKASRGKLFVPEVTAKVAHGDDNLSVNDFLSAAQRSLAA